MILLQFHHLHCSVCPTCLGIPKAKNNSLKQELGNKKRSFVESLEGEKKDFKKTRSR